jgi:hypothetical protein
MDVYIEPVPRGRPEGEPVYAYAVETRVGKVLKTLETQSDAILRISLFLALLVFCFSAAATRVEDCRTIAGDFDKGFGGGFSIGPRTVCTTETMAAYSVEEALTLLKSK